MGLLENKFIIVTGAAQGIGFSAAESILNEKANVLICDVDRVALEIAEKKLSKFSENVIFSEIDIRSENSCLLYTSPSPRDQRGSRMPSSA